MKNHTNVCLMSYTHRQRHVKTDRKTDRRTDRQTDIETTAKSAVVPLSRYSFEK